MKINPYSWEEVNTQHIFGRKQLLQNVLSDLETGKSLALVGAVMGGKTTFLKQIHEQLFERSTSLKNQGVCIVPIYYSFEVLKTIQTIDHLFDHCLKACISALEASLNIHINEGEFKDFDDKDFGNYIEELSRISKNYLIRFVFLFDNISIINQYSWYNRFWGYWNYMLQQKRFISLVVVGTSEIYSLAKDVGSPLANILNWYELQPLNAVNIKEMLQYGHLLDTKENVHTLSHWSGGNVLLLQYILHKAKAKAMQLSPRIIEDIALDFLKTDYAQNMFMLSWLELGEAAQDIYKRLTEMPTIKLRDLGKNEFSKEVSLLKVLGLCNKIDDYLTLTGNLFYQWYNQTYQHSATGIENMGKNSSKYNIFISYAHADSIPFQQIQQSLKALKNVINLSTEIIIDDWNDTRIEPGQNWEMEIQNALVRADLGILIISSNFFSSDYIMKNELPILLQSYEKGKLKLLAIIWETSEYNHHPILSTIQSINPPSKALKNNPRIRSEYYEKLSDWIRKSISQV